MATEGSGSGVAGAAGGEAPAPSASNGDRTRSSPPAAGSSSAVDDRGLHRASTMPGVIKNDEITNETAGPSNLERSRTEHRRQSNPADDPAKQLFDERIPIKKKLKMLNRIATVKDDGTVVVDVPSGLEPAAAGGTEDGYIEVAVDESLDGTDIPYRPPMQIVILIVGTRGDVQPFVAIGKRLQDYGHRVRLATHANFKEFVLTAGLEFYPLGGDPKVLAEYMVKNKGFLPSGPSEIAIQRKQIKEIIFSLLPACKDPDPDTGIPFKVDAIIANPPAYGHTHVAEALKVPIHIFFTMPWTPTSEFPHPLSRVKQSAGYRLSYQIVDSMIWLGIRDMINEFRKKKLKLRPVTYLSGAQGSGNDIPHGYIWSPHLVPKPKDWGPKIDVVGFCFLDLASNYVPPEPLVKWLEAGDKPIYVGFGSLPVQEPQKMTEIIVKALEITGQRGIINKGWGGLGTLAEPKDFVYLLDNCPHDWFFLQCKAVVHHGGAGTTAAGLKAAVFTFGSVPLKTYLPDGDIDVTAFSNSEELKEIWANLVRDALEREEKSENAEFHVKEVQYIQAEVKIIKCLVENIVVDISFNQVGGLCTLCFLEEIDNLISRNHLFKRSIILIKAWCFYESRILGAHHGLISTYALETLVLYIFHIFNNSFTGPLEVLYRFLEFFSNFDWEKFCLSLWGPVPISSLPDMTAEPPRKDSGECLLNKSFLDTCSSAYGVMPHTQDNQGQPFVSKHFNVIDPLRTNNNLGRSVSKGNYFRIRSAFAYGAKRLGKLLECPKEDLIAELDQFFTNTWIRHGSGSRPDVPIASPVDVQPLKVVPSVLSNSHRSVTAFKKKVENPKLLANQDNLHVDQANLTEVFHGYPSSQTIQKSDLHCCNLPRTVNPSFSHSQYQKVNVAQGNAKVSEQLERNHSAGLMQAERDKRVPNGLFVNDRNGQNRSRFARTRSSPELTDSSAEGFRGRGANVVGMEKPLKVDYGSRRNIMVPEVSSNHSTKSSQDESMSSLNSSHPSAKAVSDSNSVSSSYREDNGFVMNEELPTVSESSDMRHDEQVLVHLMESMKLHGFNGQIQLPMQIPSHLSVTNSHLLAPAGFSQKHLAAVPPANLTGAPWLPNMQFLRGFVPPPTQYIHNPTFATNVGDGSESEKPIASDASHDTGKSWHEYGVGYSRKFGSEERDPCIYDSDGKERSSLPNGVHVAPLERRTEFALENNGVDDETYTSMFQHQTSNEANGVYSKSSGYVNVPSSHAISSRGKALDASSWDEGTVNTTRSSGDNWGRRPAFAAPATITHSKTSWQMGNVTEHLPSEIDDGPRNMTVVPIINEASEIVAGSDSFSTQSRTSQVANDVDPSQIAMPNPLFAPFLIGSPQPRQADSSGLTFVPTGPLVPFVMLPYVPGNGDGSGPQFDRSEGIDQLPGNIAGRNFTSTDSSATSTTSCSTMTEPSGEHKPDILNSDFVSHWHNLQYGRLCQNAHPLGPVLYPFPAPQMYLQGHAAWEGPGRPPAANVNWTQMVPPGQRVFPVMPLQPATERGTGVLHNYGEDAPRHRAGTGTYLPNPKVPYRDRHSNSRNYRGGYNGDRSDYSDKEGSWINSKQRNPNHSYGRSQSERSGMRSDRQANDEGQPDRPRRTYRNDSYRHEASSQYLVQGQSFGSTSSMRRQGNTAHGVYTPQSTASNGPSALSGPPGPPFFMVYSYEPGTNHGASSSEPIEFGSLGPLPTADGDDIPRSSRQVMHNGFYGQRRGPYRSGSSHSSPDQPSSPQPRR